MVKFSGLESSSQVLFRFPEDTRWLIQEYFSKYTFHFKITNPRKLRLGSFRAAHKGELPIISLNNDLGQYSFLLVFLHELAHLHTWQLHGRRVAPHGKEWKESYRILSSPLFEKNNIPLILLPGLQKYFNSSRASFHRDVALQRILHSLDGNGHLLVLGDIPAKGTFHLSDGKQMIKLERIRTRYKCYCPSNKKYYLVSPAAQIFLTAGQYAES